MNKFSQVVLAVALSTGTAQAKPIPDNQRDHKAQTTSVTNNQDCAEQGKKMAETLVPIVLSKFEIALNTPSRITVDVQAKYPKSAWNEFTEIVHTDGRLSSSGVVKIPAENPITSFSFVMNRNGQKTHYIECLNK